MYLPIKKTFPKKCVYVFSINDVVGTCDWEAQTGEELRIGWVQADVLFSSLGYKGNTTSKSNAFFLY